MGKKKKSIAHKPTLQKETVRKLDLQTLHPDDLAQVIGGQYIVPRQTIACSA